MMRGFASMRMLAGTRLRIQGVLASAQKPSPPQPSPQVEREQILLLHAVGEAGRGRPGRPYQQAGLKTACHSYSLEHPGRRDALASKVNRVEQPSC